jgi:hypothetical protein
MGKDMSAVVPRETRLVGFFENSGVAQASVYISILGGFTYIAGVLVFSLRLEFRKFSWTSLLGQLPGATLVLTALGIVLPGLIVGSLVAFSANRFAHFLECFLSRTQDPPETWHTLPVWARLTEWWSRLKLRWKRLSVLAAMLVVSTILGLVPAIILHSYTVDLVTSFYQVLITASVLNALFIGLSDLGASVHTTVALLGISPPSTVNGPSAFTRIRAASVLCVRAGIASGPQGYDL